MPQRLAAAKEHVREPHALARRPALVAREDHAAPCALADAVAREGGLEDVGGVDGALGRARAHERVNLCMYVCMYV